MKKYQILTSSRVLLKTVESFDSAVSIAVKMIEDQGGKFESIFDKESSLCGVSGYDLNNDIAYHYFILEKTV